MNMESKQHEEDDKKNNVNEMEHKKISLVRAFLENQGHSTKEADDLTIRRFLRARDSNVEKASAMFLKYLKWRHTFLPNNEISTSEIPNEIAQNKSFLQGVDKLGRPIAVVIGAKHFQNKIGGVEEFKRFVVYNLDKLCSSIPAGHDKYVGIGDLKGWGYSNCDILGYIAAVTILQDYYPEKLAKMYLVHVPNIFMTAWKIVYPFIDNNTKKKIVFVENKRLTSTLLEDIDESQLPEIYGGKMPLVPIHESQQATPTPATLAFFRRVWQQRPACLRPIRCCSQGDRTLAERVVNVVTSLPFIVLGIHAPRKNLNMKLYANSLIGVGIASSLYHASRGEIRKYLRWADYTMIATATICMSRALRNENPKLLMAASALCLPFQPMMVSAVHTGMMEIAFAKRAYKDPDLRTAHKVHKMSSLVGGVLFVADDVFPETPFLHAAWHLSAAVGVSTINKLLQQ